MSATKTVLLIRHAETDLSGTFCGHSDPPVNARGEIQILQLLDEVKAHQLESVFTSDLQRAVTTAEAVAEVFQVPVHVRAELREIHFGDWEGLTWEQVQHRDSRFAQTWADHFPSVPPPGGEPFARFEKRVLEGFDAIRALNQNTAIVSHAGALRVILTQRFGLSHGEAWSLTKTYCCLLAYPWRGVA